MYAVRADPSEADRQDGLIARQSLCCESHGPPVEVALVQLLGDPPLLVLPHLVVDFPPDPELVHEVVSRFDFAASPDFREDHVQTLAATAHKVCYSDRGGAGHA